MINYRKKLLTKTLAITIAGFFSLEAIAAGSSLPQSMPLRGESNVTKAASSPDVANIQLKGGVKIDNKQQFVTLNLANSDLRQVLRMLADKSNKNIIMDESVAGTVTLDLVNVTVNRAFEYIMTLNQLTYWQDGNTLIVATSAKAQELGLSKAEIKPVKIKYVDAQKIADFLNSNIFSLNKPDISKAAIVTSNPSTNEVYIFGNNNDYELAKKVISHLDMKPQITTYTVNYASPVALASKICMTVFQSTAASSGSSSSSSSSSGSSSSENQVTTVCSGSSSSSGGSSGGAGGQSLSAFSSPSYMVLADPGLNQITIYGGTLEQTNMAQEIIKNFDKKEPQVYLEISIIELSEDGSKAFTSMLQGFTEYHYIYGIGGGRSGVGFAKEMFGLNQAVLPISSFTAPATFNIPTTAAASSTSPVYIPVGKNIYGAINSIVTNNKGRILANPRIIASNNSESTINIKEDIVSGVVTNVVQGASTTSSTTATHGDVGIDLTITPRISPNGYVTLDLNPSYSSVKGDDGYGGTLTRTRDFDAKNVRVKDGETLVIAGLVQETENNIRKKTPVLADLPVVGILFKDQSTSKSRSELIFMITPKIIKDDDKIESI